MSGPLVDTNVLVYVYDNGEPEKQRAAVYITDRLADAGAGVVTTQVLNEFAVTVRRKIANPLGVRDVLSRLEHFVATFAVLDTTAHVVLEAARGVVDHQFSHWDALIWAAARVNGIQTVLSEDFSSGSVVEGVGFVNPFAPGFDLEAWL